jgi:DNA invertase Pin-like site-specific DNA recombinase
MRTAIYARVSTTDKGQDTENQIHALRAWCEREGYEVVEVYEDYESGTKGRRERHRFDQMFNDAKAGRFKLVVFWSLDRFSRQGIAATIDYLRILELHGVGFRSYTEHFLDTSNELVRHILIGVMGYFAQMEAKKISERTKAGLARAAREGRFAGRPNKVKRIRVQAQAMLAQGMAKTQIAAQLGVSVKTVRAAVNE